jgi:hypothetical protein
LAQPGPPVVLGPRRGLIVFEAGLIMKTESINLGKLTNTDRTGSVGRMYFRGEPEWIPKICAGSVVGVYSARSVVDQSPEVDGSFDKHHCLSSQSRGLSASLSSEPLWRFHYPGQLPVFRFERESNSRRIRPKQTALKLSDAEPLAY